MWTIEHTGHFKRDFKREFKGQQRLTLLSDLTDVVAALANDQALDPRHRDHGLTGVSRNPAVAQRPAASIPSPNQRGQRKSPPSRAGFFVDLVVGAAPGSIPCS